jgi:hypothetical protein
MITKNTKRQGIVLGVGVLSAVSMLGISGPTQAKDKNNRKEVREARKEVKRERRDVRQANTREERRDEREDLRDARRDLREERSETGNGFYRSVNAGSTGVVTDINSTTSFDVRIGSSTFNVYTSRALPRGLSVGDVVRVSGSRVGSNDIRNASVSITSNR